jgi:hypothetical protein
MHLDDVSFWMLVGCGWGNVGTMLGMADSPIPVGSQPGYIWSVN